MIALDMESVRLMDCVNVMMGGLRKIVRRLRVRIIVIVMGFVLIDNVFVNRSLKGISVKIEFLIKKLLLVILCVPMFARRNVQKDSLGVICLVNGNVVILVI